MPWTVFLTLLGNQDVCAEIIRQYHYNGAINSNVFDKCHASVERNVVCSIAQSCLTLFAPMDLACQAPLSTGDSPCKNTGVVAMPSSRESSQPRDCIVGRFFTLWATREAQENEWVVYPFSRGTWFFTSWAIQEAREEKEYINVAWKYLSSNESGIWIRPPKCVKCGQVKKEHFTR